MSKFEPKFTDVMQAIAYHLEYGAVTVKQLATWAGLDVRTVHYWLAGENGGPSSRHVSLWLARLPAAVRVHVAIAQLAGSGLTVVTAPECDGDVRDLMGKALEVSGAAQELAEKAHETTADGILTAEERTALLASAVHVREQADQVIAATEPRQRMRAV